MPPKQQRTFSRTLSNSSANSSGSGSRNSGGGAGSKLKQNKLHFSFHSIPTGGSSSTSRPFGSRPLSVTPSFGLPTIPATPTAPVLDKGKQKEHQKVKVEAHASFGAQQVQAEEGEDVSSGSSLWSEHLAPASAEELAVHPKKVQQVKQWLTEAFSEKPAAVRYRKVLALTGPAGAGKSTTIRALSAATDLDYDVLEWQNDAPGFDPSAAYTPGSSFIERFTDFLQKAAKFPTLDLQSSHADDGASTSLLTLDSPASVQRNRVILLEDLPNLHHLPTKQLFQAALEQYIQQSALLTSRVFPNVPIVLIITESTPREDEDRWVGDSSSNSWRERIASIMDTRTALGPAIRQSPAYAEVRFNPVAPTIILKGLKRAVEKAPRSVTGALTKSTTSKPLLELLQAVAEDSNGDLRAAVNCLQFVCADSKQFETVHTAVKARHKGEKERARALRKLMPLVSGRESSLALFHALGRVLYNKREGDPGDEGPITSRTTVKDSQDDSDQYDTDDDHDENVALRRRVRAAMHSLVFSPSDASLSMLPDHMAHLHRAPSRVNVDSLWADLPVDSNVFQLYLHQNFPQFTGEVEQCEAILEAFSEADALTPLHEQYRHSSLLAYYSFLISARGTLLGLPSPVERKGQKLGKATWWDVQKKLRVMLEDVADVTATLDGGASGRMAPAGFGEGDGGTRFKRTKFNNPSLVFDPPDSVDRTDAGLGEEKYSSLLRNNSVTLLTEVFPLLAKIRPTGADSRVYELARMRFEYAGIADIASRVLDEHETGVNDNDEDEEAEQGLQGRREEEKVGQKRQREAKREEVEAEREEKMYLSEDDIADF